MAKTVPLSWLVTDTPGVCNLVIKTLAADHYYLIWTPWKPRKRVSNRMIRGRLVGRGFVTVLDGANTIAQNEFGNTTTHTFDLTSLPPSTTFWYVLADHFSSEVATYVTPPVQSITCAAPTITKSCQFRRMTDYSVGCNIEGSIPWQAQDFDDYNGWPCAGANSRACVDDLSLWVDEIHYRVFNAGSAAPITFRIRTKPNNVIVWQETIPFAAGEIKEFDRYITYVPAVGSRAVAYTGFQPCVLPNFGWVLSYGGVPSIVYHHNSV